MRRFREPEAVQLNKMGFSAPLLRAAAPWLGAEGTVSFGNKTQ
jgi:hypothetical protein